MAEVVEADTEVRDSPTDPPDGNGIWNYAYIQERCTHWFLEKSNGVIEGSSINGRDLYGGIALSFDANMLKRWPKELQVALIAHRVSR